MLQGKNAIVTGARTGIGKAVVYNFAQSGANVWAVVHREDQEWLNEMQMLGMVHNVWIKPVYIDLNDEKSIAAGMKQLISEKLPIDILVNAAGVVSPNRLIQMTSLEEMHRVMQVNFFAAVQLTQLVSRVMMRQKRGSIVNISSVSADGHDSAQAEYATSKAALDVFTRKSARELGRFGVRVNAVSPGVINTSIHANMSRNVLENMVEQTALRRMGLSAEVANAIAFLVSDEASYITGSIVRIDGGL